MEPGLAAAMKDVRIGAQEIDQHFWDDFDKELEMHTWKLASLPFDKQAFHDCVSRYMEDKPHYTEDLNHFLITARILIAQELDDAKRFMNHFALVKFVRDALAKDRFELEPGMLYLWSDWEAISAVILGGFAFSGGAPLKCVFSIFRWGPFEVNLEANGNLPMTANQVSEQWRANNRLQFGIHTTLCWGAGIAKPLAITAVTRVCEKTSLWTHYILDQVLKELKERGILQEAAAITHWSDGAPS
jgi:hypothetical protein